MDLEKDYPTLKARLSEFGQEHLLAYWEELSDHGKKRLAGQIQELDLECILEAAHRKKEVADFEHLEPSPYISLKATDLRAKALETGEAHIRAGRVAALTVAGGQGTRLGFDAPKGCFEISPIKHKTLFEVLAQKIRKRQEDYGVTIPWLVMTSPLNHRMTEAFFEQHGHFGLKDVTLFKQGTLPAVGLDGKLLLSEEDSLAMAPDGHGGAIKALVKSGILAKLKEQGIRTISSFQVDNPLLNCIDPVFIGLHINEGSEFSSKMVRKEDPAERVGLFCQHDGQDCIVEYSDMPGELQKKRDTDGQLRFRAGSIAVHLIEVGMIERMVQEGEKLPLHVARKKINAMDGPREAIKLERFIFDCLGVAERSLVVETDRKQDFSPVKNAKGKDSPDSCQADMQAIWRGWLKAAGEKVSEKLFLEISPMFASTKEGFVERWKSLARRPAIEDGLYISSRLH